MGIHMVGGVGGWEVRPDGRSRGAYRGLVHGIPCHPKPPPAQKPKAARASQQLLHTP